MLLELEQVSFEIILGTTPTSLAQDTEEKEEEDADE
jgi:hypothetical protein